ncbi:MAG TPA: single-stranded DNA-binding protein [Prolixibacteraceae bacterium]|nr:single-stranded DNA-binding protein [Prolixibacteraceae bacterium]
MSVNKVILIGNVGADPEIRHLDNNVAVANLRMATSESYTAKNGERVTSTEWHNVVLWRGLAEIAEKYIRKGKQIYVEGRIRTRSWDDKDGQKRYTTEIFADVVRLLGGRDSSTEQAPGSPSHASDSEPVKSEQEPSFDDQPEDDLPF